MKDIDVVDDRTLKVTLVGPDASFLAALAAPQCGVLDAKTVMAQGGTDAEDAKEKDKATQWLNENSAGLGALPAGVGAEERGDRARPESRRTGDRSPTSPASSSGT